MTLYKGPVVNILFCSHGDSHHKAAAAAASDQHWLAGTIMLLGCTTGWALFFILQVSFFSIDIYYGQFQYQLRLCLA